MAQFRGHCPYHTIVTLHHDNGNPSITGGYKMEKVTFELTQDSIMELLGPLDSEGIRRLREKVAALNDVTFESFILSLDRTIGLYIS